MLELTLRLVFSLAVVVGLLLLTVKVAGKRFAGRPDALVQVVHRQPLSRTTSLTVVTVGSKVLVLGTTEQRVSLLTELDPEELVDPTALDEAEAALLGAGDGAVRPDGQFTGATTGAHVRQLSGPLAGSLLSPATWKQAAAVITDAMRKR